MAAHSVNFFLRTCEKSIKLRPLLRFNTNHFQTTKPPTTLKTTNTTCINRHLWTGQLLYTTKHTSYDESSDDLLKDFEVSYEDFKYVQQVLPNPTVPQLEQHASYPTPSGWFPPNASLQSQQAYLVRRTKNHMLPVYPEIKETWYGTKHTVLVRRIEGDIWALEAELREHLQNHLELKKVTTQVHEVGRFIRVQGQHTDVIAKFLLEKGM